MPRRLHKNEQLMAVNISCGDILVRIDGPKMWTLSRIEYQGVLLGIEDSAYGTTLKFPGIGFIGSEHKLDRPDGCEEVKSLDFYLDDKRICSPDNTLRGARFTLQKTSRILDVTIKNTTQIHDNRIYESATVQTTRDVTLEVAYHFMHAWTPTVKAFLACSSDGPENQVEFEQAEGGKPQQHIVKNADWIAFYDAPSGKGVVSKLLQAPDVGGADALIVDAPNVYRKCYLMCFNNKTIPAGFNGTYRMMTGFFEAAPTNWLSAAQTLASELKDVHRQ